MIYIVEDEVNIRDLVIYTFQSTGLKARGFERASDFWRALDEEVPELVLLDIMLPDEDGISILKKIRARADIQDIPVLMLTAKGSEYDRVIGLETGADDYIPKPFGIMELVARVKAHLRRYRMTHADNMEASDYALQGLKVDIARHRVTVDGEEVVLTYKEFELLCYLFKNKNIVLTRDRILCEIWGYNFDGETRTVDVHIRTLRQKLGNMGNVIETVRGVGYKISCNE